MMTVEIILKDLNFSNIKLTSLKIKHITNLVEKYNKGTLQKSIYLTDKEVLFEEIKGIVLGYIPEINGIYYED